MSGIYNIEHYVMTWYFSNCEQGSYTCLFQWTLLHNESCERVAGRTDPYGPEEPIKHFADTTCVSPSPGGPAGRCPLNFLN